MHEDLTSITIVGIPFLIAGAHVKIPELAGPWCSMYVEDAAMTPSAQQESIMIASFSVLQTHQVSNASNQELARFQDLAGLQGLAGLQDLTATADDLHAAVSPSCHLSVWGVDNPENLRLQQQCEHILVPGTIMWSNPVWRQDYQFMRSDDDDQPFDSGCKGAELNISAPLESHITQQVSVALPATLFTTCPPKLGLRSSVDVLLCVSELSQHILQLSASLFVALIDVTHNALVHGPSLPAIAYTGHTLVNMGIG